MTAWNILERLLDFVFPRTSLRRQEGEWVHPDEYPLLRSHPVILGKESLRAQGLFAIDRVVASVAYHESPLLKEAIHLFKYKRIRELEEVLGEILVDGSEILLPPKSDSEKSELPILVPVPLHWTRQFHRGFNQAELLANCVSKARGWRIEHFLKRTRPTGHQAHRKRDERFMAMEDAFTVVPRSWSLVPRFETRTKELATRNIPSHLVLVDDISTTGATLNECAKALKAAGVKRVEGLVVAHG